MSRSSAVCVDASLVVRLLVGPQSQEIRSLWEAWAQERRDLVAPALIHYEVMNALYQYEKHGHLSADVVAEICDAALSLPIRHHSDPALHLQALQLARRFGLPACYDAHYLALGEHLGTDLWTCDARLVKKVGADLPWVRLAPEG
jgi:predicted nucleic acid-binding protein